jgi:hypothetical protein
MALRVAPGTSICSPDRVRGRAGRVPCCGHRLDRCAARCPRGTAGCWIDTQGTYTCIMRLRHRPDSVSGVYTLYLRVFKSSLATSNGTRAHARTCVRRTRQRTTAGVTGDVNCTRARIACSSLCGAVPGRRWRSLRPVVGSCSAEATPPRSHQARHEHVRRAADERFGHRADVLLELRAQRGARGLRGLEREPEREAPAALCGDCVAPPRRSS